jgi:hypothetical protein
MASNVDYPFIPKSTAYLAPGQFWSIPLADEKWACGRVLAVRAGGPQSRTLFVAGLMDWIGDTPPTAEAIRESRLLEMGHFHVVSIAESAGEILGSVPLSKRDAALAQQEPRSYWGGAFMVRSAARLSELGSEEYRRANKELAQAGLFPQIRELRSPLRRQMLEPLEDRIKVVQFGQPLSDRELKRVGRFMADYPDMRLRMYGHNNRLDLEWLRYFKSHRNLMVNAHNLDTFDGLRHLPESVTQLALGQTKKKLSLRILERFPLLTTLYLEGHTRDIEVVSELRRLEDLTLRSITLPDLSILLPLEKLWSLDIKLGGTKNLDLLPQIGSLKYLELWMIRGFEDLSPISELADLRFLFLQALRRATQLPDLTQCHRLRRIHLETMKGLTDLSPLAAAPSLEQLLLIDMPQLRPEDLAPLEAHQTLNSVRIGLGSIKRNAAAQQLLQLPDVEAAPADLYD